MPSVFTSYPQIIDIRLSSCAGWSGRPLDTILIQIYPDLTMAVKTNFISHIAGYKYESERLPIQELVPVPVDLSKPRESEQTLVIDQDLIYDSVHKDLRMLWIKGIEENFYVPEIEMEAMYSGLSHALPDHFSGYVKPNLHSRKNPNKEN